MRKRDYISHSIMILESFESQGSLINARNSTISGPSISYPQDDRDFNRSTVRDSFVKNLTEERESSIGVAQLGKTTDTAPGAVA